MENSQGEASEENQQTTDAQSIQVMANDGCEKAKKKRLSAKA